MAGAFFLFAKYRNLVCCDTCIMSEIQKNHITTLHNAHIYVLKLQYSTAFTVNNGHERRQHFTSIVSVKTEQKKHFLLTLPTVYVSGN